MRENLFSSAPPSSPWFYSVLRRELRATAEREPDKAERWLAFLETVGDDLLSQLGEDEGAAIRELVDSWQKKTDAFALFSNAYRRGLRFGWSRALGWEHTRCYLLLALSPMRWMRALDAPVHQSGTR